MSPIISIVIPARNAGGTLASCLTAIQSQRFPKKDYEIIIVDNGSTDNTVEIAKQFDVTIVEQQNPGGAFARNTGFKVCKGQWIVSTDADCVPTRNWLWFLHQAVQKDPTAIGAAGKIVGLPTESPVSNFIESIGGIDTERHLSHPTFAYAPMGNVMYSRDALFAAGGMDETYTHYPGPDLHHRVCKNTEGTFIYEERAAVFHRHPDNFQWYYQQQTRYGSGYAQFLLDYRDSFSWTAMHELKAWGTVLQKLFFFLIPINGQDAVARRGHFLKAIGHRIGFIQTYYGRQSRSRWAAPQIERKVGWLS